jgi:hypothetical protein
MRRLDLKVLIPIAAAGAILLGTGSAAHASRTIELKEGKIRTIGFRTQVEDVKVESSDPDTADAWVSSRGVRVRGQKAGRTATITVTGTIVRYVTGIPERRPRPDGRVMGPPRSIPVRQDRPFREVFRVRVVQ